MNCTLSVTPAYNVTGEQKEETKKTLVTTAVATAANIKYSQASEDTTQYLRPSEPFTVCSFRYHSRSAIRRFALTNIG